MRFIWQPQPQVVDSGSWRISRRGRLAGSGWRLGCCLASGAAAAGWSQLLDLVHRRQVGLDLVFEQAALLGAEALGLGGELHALEQRVLVRELVDERPAVAQLGQQALPLWPSRAVALRSDRPGIAAHHHGRSVPSKPLLR
jgi:hypothetical protein